MPLESMRLQKKNFVVIINKSASGLNLNYSRNTHADRDRGICISRVKVWEIKRVICRSGIILQNENYQTIVVF